MRFRGIARTIDRPVATPGVDGLVERGQASMIVTRLQEPLFVPSVTGLVYFLISFPVGRLGAWFEKKRQDQ